MDIKDQINRLQSILEELIGINVHKNTFCYDNIENDLCSLIVDLKKSVQDESLFGYTPQYKKVTFKRNGKIKGD